MTDRYRLIILHAGLGKTGTTSIQGNCYRYRELLLQHGIMYPSFSFRRKTIVNHSDCITASVCENPGKYGTAFRQQVEEDPTIFQRAISPQMDELLENPQADTLVLSGEAVAEYSDADMQALLEKLQAHSERLRVVAYIRSPQSSLESILQQRVKSGQTVDPEALVSVVRMRYERLQRNFAGLLETVNFHDAIRYPFGLVAHFMTFIGVPKNELKALDFKTNNERVTLEAYRIMLAINRRYSRREERIHGVIRRPHDMHSLMKFPGQSFQLEEFAGSNLLQSTIEEGAWLESELGFQFPAMERRDVKPLWQNESLVALERAIRGLGDKNLVAAVADFLVEEASGLKGSRPEAAGILRHIAWSLQNIETDPTRAQLERLGADYFKFSALQVEKASPELALSLMSLAGELRPGRDFIEAHLAKYTAAIDLLSVETRGLEVSRQEATGVLRRSARHRQKTKTETIQVVLESLGADYFKFAALQVEDASPKLALKLMSLARELRTGAKFIESRLARYENELGILEQSRANGEG
ncbi:MAG: hypothetical protein IMF06_02045 [Proteobacteria bacterium]|nr:hypothetical protein [Pseudomonadota bacterium]